MSQLVMVKYQLSCMINVTTLFFVCMPYPHSIIPSPLIYGTAMSETCPISSVISLYEKQPSALYYWHLKLDTDRKWTTSCTMSLRNLKSLIAWCQ